jgi:dTDP-4-dehydrorhamnose reductase
MISSPAPLKILLFGKNGQLGQALQRTLQAMGDVTALSAASTDLCGDLADAAGVVRTVMGVRPNLVVNAAAMTDVDLAECKPETARAVNALAPGVLANACAATGAWFVHYSSDYVFDGSGSEPWTESDQPGPLNVYGQTKLEGERLVLSSGARHLIFRSSWLYSSSGENFAKKILQKALEGSPLKVVNDQIGAPTSAALVAAVTARAIASVLRQPELGGIYHVAARGEASWHEYACHLIVCARQSGWVIRTPVELVEAITSQHHVCAATRPCNSRLDTQKLKSAFGLTLPEWRDGVADWLKE